jgi:hypothetical protein
MNCMTWNTYHVIVDYRPGAHKSSGQRESKHDPSLLQPPHFHVNQGYRHDISGFVSSLCHKSSRSLTSQVDRVSFTQHSLSTFHGSHRSLSDLVVIVTSRWVQADPGMCHPFWQLQSSVLSCVLLTARIIYHASRTGLWGTSLRCQSLEPMLMTPPKMRSTTSRPLVPWTISSPEPLLVRPLPSLPMAKARSIQPT